MLDERLAVAEADGKRAQMHVVEHLLGFLEAAHLERDNAAEPRHLADGHGVIGMVLQTGIEHFLHILGAGKEVHHFLRVCADGVHAHLERLEAAQDQKRLLRPEHCTRNVLESDHADLVHDLLARHREARDHVTVAVEILGRAVHDDIRAQLQRLHQQRRGKGIVHDDETVRILRMRVVRDGTKRLYQQIYAQLRAQIFSSEIAAGQPLPSYRFMSRKYQVNVATVERRMICWRPTVISAAVRAAGVVSCRWIISSSLPTAWCSTVFRPGSWRPGRSMILPPVRRWRRGRRRGNLSRWPTSSRSSGRMRSCAIRRHAGAAAASGRAQHLLRLSYVGCPLEQIPEGISCIDREIGWLLEHQTAAEI